MKKVGISLSGGGIRGLAHVGVLKVLDKHGIRISVIAGSSMGSIVGAFYAGGYSGQRIEKVICDIGLKDLLKMYDLSLSKGGIFKGNNIIKILRKYLPRRSFEDLDVPLFVNATDLYTRKEEVFSEGDLLPALRASVAFPGLMRPKRIGKKLLIDGGLVNPLALGLYEARHEVDFSIISSVATGFGGILKAKNPGIIDIYRQSYDIMQENMIAMKLATISEKYVLIQPPTRRTMLLSVKDARKMIAKGEKEAERCIDKIKMMYYED